MVYLFLGKTQYKHVCTYDEPSSVSDRKIVTCEYKVKPQAYVHTQMFIGRSILWLFIKLITVQYCKILFILLFIITQECLNTHISISVGSILSL